MRGRNSIGTDTAGRANSDTRRKRRTCADISGHNRTNYRTHHHTRTDGTSDGGAHEAAYPGAHEAADPDAYGYADHRTTGVQCCGRSDSRNVHLGPDAGKCERQYVYSCCRSDMASFDVYACDAGAFTDADDGSDDFTASGTTTVRLLRHIYRET